MRAGRCSLAGRGVRESEMDWRIDLAAMSVNQRTHEVHVLADLDHNLAGSCSFPVFEHFEFALRMCLKSSSVALAGFTRQWNGSLGARLITATKFVRILAARERSRRLSRVSISWRRVEKIETIFSCRLQCAQVGQEQVCNLCEGCLVCSLQASLS